MHSTNTSTIRFISAFLNASVVLAALFGVFLGINKGHMPGGVADFLAMRVTVKNLIIAVVCFAGGVVAFRTFGLAMYSVRVSFGQEIIQVIKACTVATIFVLLYPLTSHSGAFTPLAALYFLPVAVIACLGGRFVARLFAHRLAQKLYGRRDIIMIGSGPRAAALFQKIQQSPSSAIRVLGFVDSPNGHIVPGEIQDHMIGTLEELEDILMRRPVDEVMITLPAKSCYDHIQTAIRTCERAGVKAKYLSDIFDVSLARRSFEDDEHSSVVTLKVVHDDARLLVKRAIDIFGALVGLAAFGPLMILIALTIRLTSAGSSLFTQKRYGLRKHLFRMYKFRTMVPGAETLQASLESRNEVQGPAFKIKNDPRITAFGRILRKTSLDELPQFFNILSGEMSLVGPRPLPERDVARFDNSSLMRRFSVKPGLTCLWQINGRSNTGFDNWIQMDLRYIDTWSLSLDLKIIAKTFPSVLSGRGAV